MEMLQLFLYHRLAFFTKNIESLFNTVLGQDGIICDDICWWSGFNKSGDIIDGIYIGPCNIVELMGTNNKVSPAHVALIGSSTIVVYGRRIPSVISF